VNVLDTLRADRALAVVRADAIADAAELVTALAAGGLRCVELTFTTPDLPRHLARAATVAGCMLGAGTVRTADQAMAALDAGARFLVTPGLRSDVAAIAVAQGVPFIMGALTPTEVMQAADLGAAAVKVFPARALGPRYLADLRGPLPDVRLVASGGVSAANAADFLAAGAFAVSAGTDVVPAAAVAAGDWPELTRRAKDFMWAAR
jgi:2-dehydro-3-deoxyphosphogluconate aldolase/(4S)-4-hydroxy-2-oxoglutarate aldolase